jgi:HAD superfamily hydrolase (TIGR01549 family)
VTSHLDVVFLDVGGPIYGDRPYYEGLLGAILEARPEADRDVFWAEFEACRRDQRGPFTTRLIRRLLPSAEPEEVDRVKDRGRELWTYPPESLQPDVRPALESLRGRYRLGILANQERWVRDCLRRDELDGFFELWSVSAEVGAEKPDPAIFEHALRQAATPPERCAMVGDRLDNDIVAARRHGLRGVWLLRGEAPPEPTEDQLAGADAAIPSLAELPSALEALG